MFDDRKVNPQFLVVNPWGFHPQLQEFAKLLMHLDPKRFSDPKKLRLGEYSVSCVAVGAI